MVHAIAFSDKEELKGRYVDTTKANFQRSLTISCYSFTEIARRALPLMTDGGSLITLTYEGATRVMPSYNVMGVAKAALEASVRYLAADLGPQGVRVNAISAGPMRTLAGAVIGSARYVYRVSREASPLRRNIELTDVGGAALYLLSDLSAGVTGTVHYVDAGYHAIGLPPTAAQRPSGTASSMPGLQPTTISIDVASAPGFEAGRRGCSSHLDALALAGDLRDGARGRRSRARSADRRRYRTGW